VQAVATSLTRLPTRQDEGNNGVDNIPLVAISTGRVDGLECVFRKLGLEDNQFGNPPGTTAGTTTESYCCEYRGNGTCRRTCDQQVTVPALDQGRIRIYQDDDDGNAEGGAIMNSRTPTTDDRLTNNQDNLDRYDAVIFSCAGAANTRSSTRLNRVRNYANKGGRVFATHFEYVYLYTNGDWQNTAAWNANQSGSGDNSWTGLVNTGSPKRLLFSQWLDAPGVKALSNTNPSRVSIKEARNDVDQDVAPGAEEWITRYNDPADKDAVLHYTFNTPWDAAPENQCGRVLFSDFHVSIGNTKDKVFPSECDDNALTAQEKILAFFLFDLTACIQTSAPVTCDKKTCADYPANVCGAQSDGCGGATENCNPCPNGQTCGGGGIQGKCGGATCVKKDCAFYDAECGEVPDGCGGTINCPECTGGKICGGGGVPLKCGTSSCTPKTCEEQGIQCGKTGDGCGNVITCKACPAGTTCGGGGEPNKCGKPDCTPIKKCPDGKNCGTMPDGCGGSISCGTCTGGLTCGGGGAPNVCGAASCSPKSCVAQGFECGTVSNQCGGTSSCPACPEGEYCSPQNTCVGSSCKAKTCEELGVECGPVGDGCGALNQCGSCPAGQGCGAGGIPGKCGTISCKPLTCNDLGAACGQVADGCGGLTPNCGTCEGSLSCKNGVCVTACTPVTCAQANANCGMIADGCGGLLNCGTCRPGETCGYNGHANLCGTDGPK
ncbi:MAG TPA: hypothetical protein VM580_19465, partial [Labilithrix sp.]|nr:hypothetical protein [Labilithrix sp.]